MSDEFARGTATPQEGGLRSRSGSPEEVSDTKTGSYVSPLGESQSEENPPPAASMIPSAEDHHESFAEEEVARRAAIRAGSRDNEDRLFEFDPGQTLQRGAVPGIEHRSTEEPRFSHSASRRVQGEASASSHTLSSEGREPMPCSGFATSSIAIDPDMAMQQLFATSQEADSKPSSKATAADSLTAHSHRKPSKQPTKPPPPPPPKVARKKSTKRSTSATSGSSSRRAPFFYPNRGDPRMNKAVAAKFAHHRVSLRDALLMGGFEFPTLGDVGLSDRKIYDIDGVSLHQRKNQLNRRIRQMKKRLEPSTMEGGDSSAHHQLRDEVHSEANVSTRKHGQDEMQKVSPGQVPLKVAELPTVMLSKQAQTLQSAPTHQRSTNSRNIAAGAEKSHESQQTSEQVMTRSDAESLSDMESSECDDQSHHSTDSFEDRILELPGLADVEIKEHQKKDQMDEDEGRKLGPGSAHDK